jgi:hypothetical protein
MVLILNVLQQLFIFQDQDPSLLIILDVAAAVSLRKKVWCRSYLFKFTWTWLLLKIMASSNTGLKTGFWNMMDLSYKYCPLILHKTVIFFPSYSRNYFIFLVTFI